MKPIVGSLRSIGLTATCLASMAVAAACSSDDSPGDGTTGGSSAAVAGSSTGGNQTGGTAAGAGAPATGGKSASGGSGGSGAAGGSQGAGGTGMSNGGSANGGKSAGGSANGGTSAVGASQGGTSAGGTSAGGTSNGGSASGGKAGAGGSSTGGASGDACAMTDPLTGGTPHNSSNASGTAAGLNWTVWSNGSGGSITTYNKPAFSAAWNNSGDFLARLGLQWNATKTYDQYGTITAQLASKKTGTAGQYSYIGIYGWSVSPCVEWYIVDDSYNPMPVNPGNTTNKGSADIDGGKYTLYTRSTSGTGGSKCPGVSNWMQFYSIRQTARACGQISITKHFDAWAAAGMTLGKMDQAQILVEVGGGTGNIDFTVANVTAQ